MEAPDVALIINPASAGGRTGGRIPKILPLFRRYFGDHFILHVTRRPGEATDLARESVRRGCRMVVCAGGDGTIQETVHGMLDADLPLSRSTLGIISSGTGQGFARSLGLPSTLEEQVGVLSGGRSRRIDIGRIEYPTAPSGNRTRYFVNEFQLGIGGAVVRRVNGGSHRFNGSVAYGGSALLTAIRYVPYRARIRAEGRGDIHASCIGIMIANGEYTGGGMRLAPAADPADGRLNVLLIREQSISSRLRGFSRIYSGTHVSLPGFTYFTATRVEIATEEEIPGEADGQILPSAPCAVFILPSVLRVACAAQQGAKP